MCVSKHTVCQFFFLLWESNREAQRAYFKPHNEGHKTKTYFEDTHSS
jgi:hypothetical protein